MKLISHRGNINGRNILEENKPEKILYCLSLGYDVEVDVWNIDEKFYLGHDQPQYEIEKEFLLNKKLWCHAKNLNALKSMLKLKKINCFWHQNDDYTLTSMGFIWAFPNKPLTKNCIAIIDNNTIYNEEDLKQCYGICSDNVEKYLNKWKT
jgi:hypothetical protein